MADIPNPLNNMDEKIGTIILSNKNDNFDDIIKKDNSWEIILNLSQLSAGLWAWYPFDKNAKILQIGAAFGNITQQLLRTECSVTALEEDLYRAFCLEKRLSQYNNLDIVNSLECVKGKFDYIIYAIDKKIELSMLKDKLTSTGKLLLIMNNKLGIKYLCGEPNPITGRPFDGLTDCLDDSFRMTKQEIKEYLYEVGFSNIKFYYPFPDHEVPQIIYTDEYQPKEELKERLKSIIINTKTRVLDEKEMTKLFAKNNLMLEFSNSFIIECGNSKNSDVLYAALSTERPNKNAFATVIKNESVEKIALFDDGVQGLNNLYNNTNELIARSIPVLPVILKGKKIEMNRVKFRTLSEHMRDLVKYKKKDNIIDCIDKIYDYILKSSEEVDKSKNALIEYAPNFEWGPILKKAYIEMIPVNCFMTDNDLLFFDQEFSQENYPAKYVLYRAINDIYAFIPEIAKVLPLQDVKLQYGLSDLWKYFQKADEVFHFGLRQHNLYSKFNCFTSDNKIAINENRKLLSMNNNKVDNIYEVHLELNSKDIILFGSGKFCDEYLEKYGENYPPLFIIDNNKAKWGTTKNGIEIKSPDSIKELSYGTYRLVIAVYDYLDIVKQVEEMGLTKEDYRVFNPKLDGLLNKKIVNTIIDEKYNIGYVTGVFDLFHIGHLNLLKKCKERCHYLIVGIVNDELVRQDKKKEPYIQFCERIEIVKQCKYVDRVVEIDSHNTDKLDAWKELQFNCLFSGNDHENENGWIILKNQLKNLGVALEFFPYTQGTSSSILQKILAKEIK